MAFLGAGDDTFQWDPGDGSDTVEGQDGTDTMLFNGSGEARSLMSRPTASGCGFTRNLGNIVMDLNDVEAIDLNALGGTDTTTVNDVSGTDLVEVNINLAGRSAGRPAMPSRTPSSSTAPTAPTSSTSSARGLRCPWSGCRPS